VDPFSVSIEDKVNLLLRSNAAALDVAGARFVNSSLWFLREDKLFASTDGTVTTQTIYRTEPGMAVTAVSPDGSDFQTRQSTDLSATAAGWEYVAESDLAGDAARW